DAHTPGNLSGGRLQAQQGTGRLFGRIGAADQAPVAQPDEDLVAVHRRRTPGRQLRWRSPERLTAGGVEAKDFGRFMHPANAAADVQTPAGHDRAGIDVDGRPVVPALGPVAGVQAVHAVVPRAEIDAAVDHARARLDVALRLELPQFAPGGGVE